MFISVNPFTSETIASYPFASTSEIDETLERANEYQQKWRKLPFEERGKKVSELARLIEANHEQLAKLASLEMGKTFTEAKLEVLKCVTACEYYAKQAKQILQPTVAKHIDGRTVTIFHEPLGVVLGIFPWNFPYWQIVRSAIPIIMAGNTMLAKPAPNTPECALALQSLISKAGLEPVIQTIFANETQIKTIIADKRIKACTLTGSEKAGAEVASQAAHNIKKSVLELGGSDPFVVLDDADLDLAISNAISARFQNNGQSCIAAKRYILHQGIAKEFTSQLIEKIKQLKQGDPLQPETNIGPLARLDLKIKLAQQVTKSIEQGAQLLYQAEVNPSSPCFYPPTILTNIPSESVAYNEELFGPVLSLFVVQNDNEAILLANDTEFGLGASIWTKSIERATHISNELETGQVFINAVTRSNAAFPFGGVKKSGFGRELGPEGLKEFCYIKTIWK